MAINLPSSDSNENKTGVKLPKQHQFADTHGNPVGDHLKPFIDKIHISLPWPGVDEVKELTDHLPTYFKSKPDVFLPTKKKTGYHLAQHVSLDGISNHAHLQMFPYDKDAKSFARFEFNPSLLGPVGMDGLHFELEFLCPGGLAYLYKFGQIYKIELSVDIHGHPLEQCGLFRTHGTSSKDYRTDGRIETIYLGKKKTSHTIIYDKRKQLADVKNIELGFDVVRIERVLIGQKLKPSELANLKNPFDQLFLTPCLPPPPNPKKDWEWIMFEATVKARGLKNALSLLPEDRGEYYRAYLKKHQHPWWQPNAIWKHWPQYLIWLHKELPFYSACHDLPKIAEPSFGKLKLG